MRKSVAGVADAFARIALLRRVIVSAFAAADLRVAMAAMEFGGGCAVLCGVRIAAESSAFAAAGNSTRSMLKLAVFITCVIVAPHFAVAVVISMTDLLAEPVAVDSAMFASVAFFFSVRKTVTTTRVLAGELVKFARYLTLRAFPAETSAVVRVGVVEVGSIFPFVGVGVVVITAFTAAA